MPFRDAVALEEHFFYHGPLLGIETSANYEARADAFMHGALCQTCYECYRPHGGRVRFNNVTNEYATLSAYGYIATYMILESITHEYPTNWEYYQSRCN